MWTGHTAVVGVKEIDTGQYDVQRDVDYVSGCCLLVKSEVVQRVGLFDESYFCYWDENDYCARAGEAGYRIVYTPSAVIWHRKTLKQKLWARVPEEESASALAYYFWARNRFKFMRKHTSRWQYRSFLFYFFSYHFWLTSAVCLLYHRSIRQLVAFCRGTKDGLLDSDDGARFYISD